MERLSSVAAEMARPRIVESAKRAEATSAGQEGGGTTLSLTETPAPPDHGVHPIKHAEFILASRNQIPA